MPLAQPAQPGGPQAVPMPNVVLRQMEISGRESSAAGPSASRVLVLPLSPALEHWKGLAVWTAPGSDKPEPCSPGYREETKDEGILGVPGAQEENILCERESWR